MTGKLALVTGAGSGINRAIALRLAETDEVAVCDIDAAGAEETVASIRAQGGRASAWMLDVTDRDADHATVRAVAEHHGRGIEILVNGAGFADKSPFLELTLERWRAVMAVHLEGPFHLTQAVLPAMVAGGYGRIIGIGSLGAQMGNASHEHYATAKAGVVGFAKSIAKEFGLYGVTANVVVPGVIDTPLLHGVPPEGYAHFAQTSVGRIGTGEDVAEAVAYLAGDAAGFVTGTVMYVNGGVYV